MIRFVEEDKAASIDAIKPLLLEHYAEVALYQDKVKYEPDFEKYLDLGDIFRLFLAKDGDKVIGYVGFLVSVNMHYKSHKYAVSDILYVDPTYRGRGVGDGLLLYAESKLREAGVSVITLHMKVLVPFDGLCKRLGYDNVERVYGKYLGD